MKVTREVITDLLPLYHSGDCSPDTKRLITEFLESDPEFARYLRIAAQKTFPTNIPPTLRKQDEMTTLARTQRLLRLRSVIMGLAIFFTLVPFSFLYTHDKMYWLMQESPSSALVYGLFAVGSWIGYAVLRNKTKTF